MDNKSKFLKNALNPIELKNILTHLNKIIDCKKIGSFYTRMNDYEYTEKLKRME